MILFSAPAVEQALLMEWGSGQHIQVVVTIYRL